MLSVVPVRSEPSDRSEMVSQLLFGELVEIPESESKWHKVKMHFDGYEGWVDSKQISLLTAEEYFQLRETSRLVCTDLVQIIQNLRTRDYLPITIGSSLPGLINGQLNTGQHQFSYNGGYFNTQDKPTRSVVTEQAMMYLNSPYLWGGRSPFGIDCSGLVQVVFKQAGINLKRDTREQALQGETIPFVTEALPGDIAFFDNDDQDIIHTGILLGENRIIHASGMVRLDAIDHHGIFNYSIKRYSHKLRLIKRVLPLF